VIVRVEKNEGKRNKERWTATDPRCYKVVDYIPVDKIQAESRG